MSSENPLASAVSQSFQQGEATLNRVYRGVAINPNDPDAYNQLTDVEPALPQIGEALAGTGFRVKGVALRPIGSRTDVSDVVITYSTRPFSGGIATSATQPPNEITFEVFPEVADVTVVGAKASPIVTKTVELGPNGLPADPPVEVGTAVPEIERTERTFRLDRARVIYTVTGTASALGLPTDFSFGTVPLMLVQQRKIHVIGGVPLLYRTGSIRQTTRGISPSAHSYAISHEWVYDGGILWDNRPDGWAEDPPLGPSGDSVVVAGSLGVTEQADGDVLSGVFLPNILAPAAIRPLFDPSGTQRYIAPPFCEADLVLKVDHSFPYPSFVPRPIYTGVDVNAWQNFPGIAPFTGSP